MVLTHCRLATLLTLCLLQACSRYSLKPEPVIVPVNVPSPPSLIEKNSPTSLVHLPRTQATQINEEQTSTQASTSDKPEKKQVIIESTILETLLSKASKAIKAQQWLRAQRVLEQALRVKPYHAKTYQLYGEVSASMGLKEKAKSMYLRALNLEKNRQAQDHIRHKLIELEKE